MVRLSASRFPAEKLCKKSSMERKDHTNLLTTFFLML